MATTIDDLFTSVGVGRWTLFVFLTYVCWSFLLPPFSLGGAFYNPVVEHWCRVPELENSTWTLDQRLNYSIPWEMRGEEIERSRCHMYVRDYDAVAHLPWSPDLSLTGHHATTLDTQPCVAWDYDTSAFTSTVASEWDLVCERAYLSPLFQSAYFFGCAFGDPLLGCLSDKYGRKRTIAGAAVAFVLMATTSALSRVYPLMVAAWFLMGVIHPICGVTYVKVVEASPRKYRALVGILTSSPFALGGMAFTGLAYLVRDWRTLQLICLAPAAILLLHLPFSDESPRWLCVTGRVDEAARVLRKAARWHRVHLPPHDQLVALMHASNHEAESKDSSVRGWRGVCGRVGAWAQGMVVLVATPILRRITLAMFGCFLVTGVTFWGMSLAGTTFNEDPFVYMVFSCAMEVPGYTMFAPIVQLCGRRRVLAATFAMCCVCVLSTLAIPSEWSVCVLVLALVGKLFITGSYNILYLVATELFPTCVRSRGLNLSSMMARVGSIISPFVVQVLAQRYWWAPSVLFGACSGVGCVLALLLPESSQQPLTDTIEELQAVYGLAGAEKEASIPLNQQSAPLTLPE